MRRRTWVVLAAAVLAAVAVIIGAVVATGLGGGDTTRPTGAETVLRLQAVEERVSCGSGPAAVYIYLDDLAARPSPRQADISYGVAGFQFLLRYDPQIVRIADLIDVQLNPRLSQEDADRDGVARSFFPVSDIDDGAGRALLGGASFVPSVDDRLEEGLDPVAKGEPLLLMTVRFLPVGHGATALTLSDPEGTLPAPLGPAVADPSGQRYEPLVLKGAGLTVEGGDCPEVALATPRPTPKSTSTPFVPPTLTSVPWKTVTAPQAPDAGRTDCPADWVAYSDPQDRYSICYPADFQATASDFAINIHSPRAPGQIEDLVSVVASWNATPGTIYYPASPENCSKTTGIVEGPISSDFFELTLSGRPVAACFTVGPVQSSLHGSMPLADDGSEREGFIRFLVNFTGPDLAEVPAIGQAVIESLSVSFR